MFQSKFCENLVFYLGPFHFAPKCSVSDPNPQPTLGELLLTQMSSGFTPHLISMADPNHYKRKIIHYFTSQGFLPYM